MDLSAPILVLQRRVLTNRCIGVTAVTAYGRTISTVVPFFASTDAEIDAALRLSWALQVEADNAKACALWSFEQDMVDGYALDDPDTPTTVG